MQGMSEVGEDGRKGKCRRGKRGEKKKARPCRMGGTVGRIGMRVRNGTKELEEGKTRTERR